MSGIYYKNITLERPTFKKGGVDVYSVYPDPYSGVWTMSPTLVESYPEYDVSRTICLLIRQFSQIRPFSLAERRFIFYGVAQYLPAIAQIFTVPVKPIVSNVFIARRGGSRI